jgi:hypothetical protein
MVLFFSTLHPSLPIPLHSLSSPLLPLLCAAVPLKDSRIPIHDNAMALSMVPYAIPACGSSLHQVLVQLGLEHFFFKGHSPNGKMERGMVMIYKSFILPISFQLVSIRSHRVQHIIIIIIILITSALFTLDKLTYELPCSDATANMFNTWKYDPETDEVQSLRQAFDPISARSSQHQACDRCHEKKVDLTPHHLRCCTYTRRRTNRPLAPHPGWPICHAA